MKAIHYLRLFSSTAWRPPGCFWLWAALLLQVIAESGVAAEPWSTYRGNPQRTGNTDGIAGPSSPQVLWVLKSQEGFIAAPVPFDHRLFVADLGAFNISSFRSLDTDPKAGKREVWAKTTPYLTLPTVSSPAIADGMLIFGDGMHQTDGAVLHCLQMENGLPLWRLPVPGRLVHLEGSPTVLQGKVYIGGGAAGVLCVHLNRVTLDGKERKLAEVQKALEAKWEALRKQFEIDSKKCPCFTVPPSEDQLPKPVPVRAWQQGAGHWHVDAPVAVVGDRVLAASAFLDKEQVGDRAVFCLGTGKGEVRWKTPLQLNPWGGPTVADKLVVIGGSTIGYDPKALADAQGEITALDLATGELKWRKEIKGGVLSCVAVADGKVVATAGDGKVRAFELTTGAERWVYDAHQPFFAPPALAAGTVYVGDLKGVVHAIDLADGKPKWTLDLAKDTQVQAPGMIYGGPAVHGGRVFVATCNLEGPFAQQPTVVVCIGEK
jgi:outer membrane protein assembly factor BamB